MSDKENVCEFPSEVQDPFDLDSLRSRPLEETDFADELPTLMRVGKPKKDIPFRVHPDKKKVFAVYVLEKETGTYAVSREVAEHPSIRRHVKEKMLVPAMNVHLEQFLMPVSTDIEGLGKDAGVSMRETVKLARTRWVRMEWSPEIKRYRCIGVPETAAPKQVKWPEIDINDMIKRAFRDRFINDLDHDLLRPLLGDVLL